MAKSLESPTKLTEFAPLNSEAQQPGLISAFSRWFGGKTNKSGSAGSGAVGESRESSASSSRDDLTRVASGTGDVTGLSLPIGNVYGEGRTLVSVLTRVSNLLAQKGTYNEAELKQYWMPDSVSKECYECNYKFTTLRRRHHCRICGQIFCSRCCHQQVPGKLMGYSGDLRACTYCCHIVLSCLQSFESSSDLSTDLRLIQEDLKKKLAFLQPNQHLVLSEGGSGMESEPKPRSVALKRKVSVSFQEERFTFGVTSAHTQLTTAERKVLLHDSNQLKALHEELLHSQRGISLQNHRYKLRSVSNCCIGSEVVDWLLSHDKATSRIQAVAIGQALIDANFLECFSSHEQLFVDGYSLYRPKVSEAFPSAAEAAGEEPPNSSSVHEDAQEPLWVRQIGLQDDRGEHCSTSFSEEDPSCTEDQMRCHAENHRDLMESLRKARLNSRTRRAGDELFLSQELNPLPSPSYPRVEFSPQTHESKVLNDLFDEHTSQLMKQLLSSEGLAMSWAEALMPLVTSVAFTVRPDVKDDDDDMDIRQYVHLKKVEGGTKADSRIIHGVVCSKNVANRSMARWVHDPKILLLSSAIDYQRVGSKLISLEPLMMQENEYLKNAVAKIAAFKPEVLVVEKVVSGLAQEKLVDLGVTLVLNMKPSVMDRVSRCCQADIVPSIDAHVTKPRLGSCRLFHVESVPIDAQYSKTLMFFDGCQPRLGCTVLLRGGTDYELRKVKKVLKFMIFACYNARMERSFLSDEFAIPRTPGSIAEIFDEQDTQDKALPAAEQSASSPVHDSSLNTFESSSLVIVDSESFLSDDDGAADDGAVAAGAADFMQQQVRVQQQQHGAQDGDSVSNLHFKCVSELDDPLHEYLRSRQGDLSMESTPVDAKIASSLSMQASSLVSTTMLFRKAMEDTILSVSPLVRQGLPFLETEIGRHSPLRKYLPDQLYYSQQFKQESPARKSRYDALQDHYDPARRKMSLKEQAAASRHPFLRAQITPTMSRNELLTLLADFRARGARPKSGKDRSNSNKVSLLGDAADGRHDEQEHASVDCLDPFNHQQLCVLFSSYCPTSSNAPNFCVSPWVIEMEFYGRNDISLGGFLERYCFHNNYACPLASCQSPMTAHVRRFVHDSNCILVIIRQLANPVNGATPGDDRSILMWSWCKKCKQVSPISTMSYDTWHYSFAKYLELRFYGNSYCRRQMPPLVESTLSCACPHSLHTEHFHYFGCRDLVASFKYTPVTLRETVLPPTCMATTIDPDLVGRLIEQVRFVAQCGHGLYASIGDWLGALTPECMGTKLEACLSSMIEQQIQERNRFRKRIEEIQLMLTSPNLSVAAVSSPGSMAQLEESLWNISDHQVLLKRIIADTVSSWNVRIQDLIAAKKKEDKMGSSLSKAPRSLVSNSSNVSLDVDKLTIETAHSTDLAARLATRSHDHHQSVSDAQQVSPNASREDSTRGGGGGGDPDTRDASHSSSLSSSPSNNRSPFQRFRSSSDVLNVAPSPAGEFHFRIEDHGSGGGGGAKSHHRTVSQASSDVDPNDGRYSEAKTVSLTNSRLSLGVLLSITGASSSLLNSPFQLTEHHMLPPGSCVPLVVYENEPSSIIAYALASVDYDNQLADLQSHVQMDQSTCSATYSESRIAPDRWFDNVEREEPGCKSSASLASVIPGQSVGGVAPVVAPAIGPSLQHLEMQFSDSSTKFYCRVYYAEQFRLLRAKVFPAGEERFIRSLSRCVPWAACGGKSGSTFCKTLDDRFVLKQMSKMEIQSFVDLAPNYLIYMQQAHRDNRPTAFCKIVGAYRIVFKNSQNNSASKQDLLVMENLFYNRNVSKKFDLKGSERNRLVSVSETEMSDCVLLDENLMKIIWENPFYLRDFSPNVLNSALNHDTQFLASQLVMDYSLLVGVDEDTNQLIVGIIDYIRTFTWDKRLETFVKSSGILGGQGKMPTVVSPELYRTRFCEAMNRYFLGVPDKWTGLGCVEM